MDSDTFEKISGIPCPAAELDAWHRLPGAFERLKAPWDRVEVLAQGPITNGQQCEFRIKTGPIWRSWIAEYRNVIEGEEFTDVQVKGPFSEWSHRHRYLSKGAASDRCTLKDEITFKAPLGPLGKFLVAPFIRRKLERTFAFRHDLTLADIERRKAHPSPEPMRILISGASGLVGTALIPFLRMRGHEVLTLTRSPDGPGQIGWDPDAGQLDLSAAGTLDAVIHLAGENVASGRWNKARMDRILQSRRRGTRLLADTLAVMVDKPRVMISASGVNYYELGAINRQDEDSPIGTQFLSEVCREWEQGTRPAEEAGIRVCKLRIGVVLSPEGGALKKMLLPFKLCAGGRIGSGRQHMPWIAIDDLVDMIDRALGDERWSGPVNAVAGEPPTNREFTRTLARVLKRPAILPAPGFAVRLLLGKMADETILADLPVYSTRLKDELGYQLRHPDLEAALRHLLGAHPREARSSKIEVAAPPIADPGIALTPEPEPPTVPATEKSGGAGETS